MSFYSVDLLDLLKLMNAVITVSIISPVLESNVRDLPHTRRMGFELREPEQITQQPGNLELFIICNRHAHDAIPWIAELALPKVAHVDRHKSRLFELAQQSGYGFILDDGIGA